MSKVIKVRHVQTGDTRRLVFSDWPDLSTLHNALLASFQLDCPAVYSLKYKDVDGDQISITSTAELHEAALSSRGGMLTLLLGPASQRSLSVAGLPAAAAAAPPSSYAYARPLCGAAPYLHAPSSACALPSAAVGGYSASPSTELSVGASQAPLFIDECAPPAFAANMALLLGMGYGWEQVRDTLIDYGGDYDKALAELRSGPARRPSYPTSRHYFSISFARAVQQLQTLGFTTRAVVAALIRNAGVAQNAALELASIGSDERCPQGHVLEVSSYNIGDYARSWYCDRCGKKDMPGQRWFCLTCKYDVCFGCKPAPVARLPPAAVPEPPAGAAPVMSDMSLPPSLLEPVRLLEAMGFNDRMRVIEALVKNSGDVVRCATELAEERRKQEEQQAEYERRQRRAQRQAAAKKAREEAALRAAEQRRQEEERRQEQIRLRELENKRRDAAKIAVQNPEKIGSDLAYLLGMGFDPVSSTSSLFNAGGDLQVALDELLQKQRLQ